LLPRTDGRPVELELRSSSAVSLQSSKVAVLFASILLAAILAVPSPLQFTIAHQSQTVVENLVAPATAPEARNLIGMPSWNQEHRDWAAVANDDGHVNVIFWFGSEEQRASAGLALDSARDIERATELMREFRNGERRAFSTVFDGFSASVSVEALEEWFSVGSNAVQVHPDIEMHTMLSESVSQVGADQVWSMLDSYGRPVEGTGVVVAVIDTGVDYTHPDLGGGIGEGYKVVGGYDFCNDDSDPMDDNGHGTHVAGIIAADGGITGVAPGASILAYKVLGMDGSGLMSDVVVAIEAAIDPNGDGDSSDHADVISMSLGGDGSADDPVCLAVRAAVEAGVVVVAAAGNSGPSMGSVASPGIAPDAITVGATNRDWTLASFSSRGTGTEMRIKPEISAPGVEITSTVPFSGAQLSSPTGYLVLSGTSMATPHVSGVAALLLQMHYTWSPEQVKSALVTEALGIDESLWNVGAGGLWAPGSIAASLFSEEPMVSYGFCSNPSQSFSVTNAGTASAFAISSSDSLSLYSNGSSAEPYWANLIGVVPTSISLGPGASGELVLSVDQPGAQVPEGYYEGSVVLADGVRSLRVAVGYVILSQVNVHVFDVSGSEVFDPYGGVWIYDLPTATTSFGVRARNAYAPPASFLVPAGEYSVHAAGHQLIYHYSDPYLLSQTVTINRLQTLNVSLRMSEARAMTLDLETDDGLPIYVRDYRVYCRYVGEVNVSFDLVGSDYAIKGSEFPSLKKSSSVFVSETSARVGISIAGFSYSPDMWDFMSRNLQHWYEQPGISTPCFSISASADLQYLLAWEFDGVDAATPLALELEMEKASTYVTKYDVPGVIGNVWGDWGRSLAMGGQATFFNRRDTQTSLNPFYSGMTRTTFVQGVFSELYFPGSLFEGVYIEHFFEPDYSHLVRADTMSDIFLPDRYYLSPVEGGYFTQVVGSGPFYPSVKTQNSNETLVLFHPLLRDRAGLDVGGMYVPYLNLYLNGQLRGIYQLSEFMARRNAIRHVSLEGGGFYTAEISYQPTPDICNDVSIVLGFRVPSEDRDPPQIAGLEMPQRFIPGSTVDLAVRALDESSISSVEVSWRPSGSTGWQSVAVLDRGSGNFSAQIQTGISDTALDLKLRVSDSYSNYIEYTAKNAALAQVPISFSLLANPVEIGYRNADVSIVVSGSLVDSSGAPLSETVAIPLEMMLGDRKVAMLLDEYVGGGSHSHNGTILFDWHFNPVNIFSGPNQTVEIVVTVDLGVYEPVSQTITLRSTWYTNVPPIIVLESPDNGSLIASGELIDLDIVDAGQVSAEAYLDDAYLCAIQSPWQIDTSTWTDGQHTLRIVATDDEQAVSSATFAFSVDAVAPYLEIVYPLQGSRVPVGADMVIEVHDTFLDSVTYSLDGGPPQVLNAPYVLPMDPWPSGYHEVSATAVDLVGRSTTRTVAFEIALSTLVIELISPANGAVVRSGTPIAFTVVGEGNVTCRWSDGDEWNDIFDGREVPTSGWPEGVHTVRINATSDLGGWDEMEVVLTIDDTQPVIVLLSPQNLSFVDETDTVSIQVLEDNFASVHWYVWGVHWSSTRLSVTVFLDSSPSDGYFSIEVEAFDLAGNKATATFVFAMDSEAPLISLEGLNGSGAIGSGQELCVRVEDVFLTVVQASIDGADLSVVPQPYVVNMSSLSPGWHQLQVIADDASGKRSIEDFEFYLDTMAPSAVIVSGEEFSRNQSLEVIAEATDEYGLGAVELRYELPDGSYAAVAMHVSGANYSAVLESGKLRDGMVIYVAATDTVGNVGVSEQLVLHASASGSGSPGSPTSPDGGILGEMGVQGLLLIAALVFVVAIVSFLHARRSRRQVGDLPVEAQSTEKERSACTAASSSIVGEQRSLDSEAFGRPCDFSAAKPATKTGRASAGSSPKPKHAALVDAIPDVLLAAPPGESEEGALDIDYGELIERELIIPNLVPSLRDKLGGPRPSPLSPIDSGPEKGARRPLPSDPAI